MYVVEIYGTNYSFLTKNWIVITSVMHVFRLIGEDGVMEVSG
jgi:hypothetical protein